LVSKYNRIFRKMECRWLMNKGDSVLFTCFIEYEEMIYNRWFLNAL